MTKIFAAIVAVFVLTVLPCVSSAQKAPNEIQRTTSIGAKQVNLALPDGYCYLDDAQPSDAEMLSVMTNVIKGRNRLLAGIANCRELVDWRSGKRALLAHHGNFQTQSASEHKNLAVPRAKMAEAICAQYRGNKLDIGKILLDVKKRSEASVAGLKMNEQKFLGEIETTDEACYAGIYQRFKAQNGVIVSQFGVIATTLIKGKFVFIYLFAPEDNDASLKALVAKSKDIVRRFWLANGG